jgi:hypothetical protein
MTIEQPRQTFAAIGNDIGNDVFHIIASDISGDVVLRKQFERESCINVRSLSATCAPDPHGNPRASESPHRYARASPTQAA